MANPKVNPEIKMCRFIKSRPLAKSDIIAEKCRFIKCRPLAKSDSLAEKYKTDSAYNGKPNYELNSQKTSALNKCKNQSCIPRLIEHTDMTPCDCATQSSANSATRCTCPQVIRDDLRSMRFGYHKSNHRLVEHCLPEAFSHTSNCERVIRCTPETGSHSNVPDKGGNLHSGKQSEQTKPVYMAEGSSCMFPMNGTNYYLNISNSNGGGCTLVRVQEPPAGNPPETRNSLAQLETHNVKEEQSSDTEEAGSGMEVRVIFPTNSEDDQLRPSIGESGSSRQRLRQNGFNLFLREVAGIVMENAPDASIGNISKAASMAWKELNSQTRCDWNRKVNAKSDETPLQCGKCKRTFTKIKHARYHSKNCGEVTCSVCGKVFKSNILLQKHRKAHVEDDDRKCRECGKLFSSKQALKRHFYVHNETNLFNCSLCQRKFSTKGSLVRHNKNIHH